MSAREACTSLSVRPATMDDARTLLAWRNDPETCAASKSNEPIAWEGHIAWLTSRLSRASPDLYVAEISGIPVATYRIENGSLSYAVAPERRREGIASDLLAYIREHHGRLIAEVKPHNIASIKVAERAGHDVVLLPS